MYLVLLYQNLSLVLDTSKSHSPVKMIRAYRTSKGGRVVITLKEEKLITQLNALPMAFLIVKFPISESMKLEQMAAAQSASSVSPGDPNEGAENTYSGELLIGESGKTVDPQSVWSGSLRQ